MVFILDRSGSMFPLTQDTIGGYNGMMQRQKSEEGEAAVTTVLFDDRYEMLYEATDIKKVPFMTANQYYARGSTALLDAVGKTVTAISRRHKNSVASSVPAKTVVVIITDGEENASRKYTLSQIKELIEYQKKRYGWEFIFIGANIDAISVADTMGIDSARAANYHADSEGTDLNFTTLDTMFSKVRKKDSAGIDDFWKDDIDKDFTERKSK